MLDEDGERKHNDDDTECLYTALPSLQRQVARQVILRDRDRDDEGTNGSRSSSRSMTSTSTPVAPRAQGSGIVTPVRNSSRQETEETNAVSRSIDSNVASMPAASLQGQEPDKGSGSSSAGASPSRVYTKNNGATPSGSASFYPASDAQTYRDLLIFEERLKQNAARLVKRKKKYQAFLVLLCIGIAISAYYVFMQPAKWQPLHYMNVSHLLITSTMLLLFFASGMYAERITAANKFVPQANRSLRAYNLYLNTRTTPQRSVFSFFWSSPPSPTGSQSALSLPGEKESPAATRLVRGASVNGAPGIARRMAIPSIPRTSNPRGELIFGSKVSSQFREGYERYRAAFERRRQEKLEERRMQGWRGWRIFRLRKRDGHGADPERGAHAAEKARTSTPPLRGSGAGGAHHAPHSSGSMRQSPRAHRSRLRESGAQNSVPASESSSRASSRRSSPSSSPKHAPRARLAPLDHSSHNESLVNEVSRIQQTAEEDKKAGHDSDSPSPSPRRTSSTLPSLSATYAAGKEEEATALSSDTPDPSAVASRADDRLDPVATLREPAGI